MRSLLIAAALVGGSLIMTSEAEAQYVVRSYYAPGPVVTYSAPAYYAAPPVRAYRPVAPAYYAAPSYGYNAYYAPAYAPAYYPARRGGVAYYSGYGGYEVRIPGQPVRNAFRAVIP